MELTTDQAAFLATITGPEGVRGPLASGLRSDVAKAEAWHATARELLALGLITLKHDGDGYRARKTWKQLNAEGVKRCYIVLYNRKTNQNRGCANRVADQTLAYGHPEHGLCEKHRYVGRDIHRINMAGIEAERRSARKSNWSEDDD